MLRVLHTALAVALVLSLVPARADAAKWLAWLEELSGPGPFHGWVVTADIACLGSAPSEAESAGLLVVAAVKSLNGSDAVATKAFDDFMAPIYQRDNQQLGGPDTARLAEALGLKVEATLNGMVTSVGAPAPGGPALNPIALWTEFERQRRRFTRCRVDRSNNLLSVQLELGRYRDDLEGKRYAGDTRLTTINAIAYLPVERLVRLDWKRSLSPAGRFLELGAGVGAYGFKGSSLRDADLWRGVVPFRLRIIPSELLYALTRTRKNGLDVSLDPRTEANRWRRFLQAFEYRIGQDLVLGTLDSRLFGDSGPKTTNQTHEWVRSYGFNLDLGIAFRAMIGH